MKFVQIATHTNGAKVYARENCPKCYGRGYIGFQRPVKGTMHRIPIGPVMCRCVFGMPKPVDIQIIKKFGLRERIIQWVRKIIGAGEARKRAVQV